MNRRGFLRLLGLVPFAPLVRHLPELPAPAAAPLVDRAALAGTLDAVTAQMLPPIIDDVFAPNPIFQKLTGAYWGSQVLASNVTDTTTVEDYRREWKDEYEYDENCDCDICQSLLPDDDPRKHD